jgi:hypothetical protein
MKKLAPIIAIIAAVLIIWFIFNTVSEPDTNTTAPANQAQVRPNPSNGAFIIDDASVSLKNGLNTQEIEGSSLEIETTLTDDVAYGDINADGKDDAAVILVQAGGGSGVFVYAAAYVSGPVNYKGSNAVFLGDRVDPQSVSINNAMITVTYLDRKDDEPLAAEPTVKKTMRLIWNGSELVEAR